MNEAWNHALITIIVFASWTVALAWIGGSKIFWDYESFDENAK